MATYAELLADLRTHTSHCRAAMAETANQSSTMEANRAQWSEEVNTLELVIDTFDVIADLLDHLVDFLEANEHILTAGTVPDGL